MSTQDNCFLAAIIGSVAIHIFKLKNFTEAQQNSSEVVTKVMLSKENILDRPLAYIRRVGPEFGVHDIPQHLLSKEFCCPMVNEENLWEKMDAAEYILYEQNIPLFFNLYHLQKSKVSNTLTTENGKKCKTSRIQSAVTFFHSSRSSKLKKHQNCYPLVLEGVTYPFDKEVKQFHLSLALNISKFAFHNTEIFYWNKSLRELSELVNVSVDSLTKSVEGKKREGDAVDGGIVDRRRKNRYRCWETPYICNACSTSFLRRHIFQEHIKHALGVAPVRLSSLISLTSNILRRRSIQKP